MSTREPITPIADSLRTAADRTAAKSQIASANRAFMDVFARGDAALLASLYTRGAQLFPAHADVIAGTAAIATFWSGVMKLGIASAKLDTVEVEEAGDTAIEVGRYTLLTADGAPADRGKYVVVWHREDGSWKLHRDIWTTSQPAPATP
ncbi:MAG TPA: DUF4440 domain-containing protein [Gemmatimonadaceae bacterium]|nr:DUF4440 domain-containing protein [Gemmatimonadaceae bacterium]